MDLTEFSGAKVALFIGDQLLVIRRDDRPDIPWPDFLDLPGGGRDPGETPEQCVLRETREEVSLGLGADQLIFVRAYDRPHGRIVFFAAHLPASAAAQVVLGDEGQGWMLMDPEVFAAHPEAVPHFREQVTTYLAQMKAAPVVVNL